jgi:holo-[acyl-carrier protein] synthase
MALAGGPVLVLGGGLGHGRRPALLTKVAAEETATMRSMQVIAHGIDLVDIARIETMLSDHGWRFVERCFTDVEQRYADASRRHRAQRYAARFACKEAVLKALGTGWRDGIAWRDIEVSRQPSGSPRLVLAGRCAQLAQQLRIAEWHVTLSHTPQCAMASVIACGQV